MISTGDAIFWVLAMGGVILFCRAFPFIFFQGQIFGPGDALGPARSKQDSRKAAFINFVEKTVPPAAMTVLAFNALAGAFQDSISAGLPALIASVMTALLHVWKRNAMISIFGGTGLYMILINMIDFRLT